MSRKKYLLFILFLISSLFLSACNIPNMQNLKLQNDPNLYAGEGEICENQYVKVNCAKGLECMLVASKPHIIKACFPPGTELDEDLVNRQEYDDPEYYNSKYGTNRTINNSR